MKSPGNPVSGGLKHPFYPLDLNIPNYVPNDKSAFELLAVFFGVLSVALAGLWLIMASNPQTKGKIGLKIKLSWFFLCGFIHCILEGYFGVFHKTIPEGQSFLAQMWKEYGQGDSRYVIADTFTVCMENITAFVDGPLAFLAVYAFLTRSPYRYVVQLVLSLFQLYGDVLYMSIEVVDGFIHGPFGHPLYFWFYFVFLNLFWIVVPFLCIVDSWRHLSAVQSTADSKGDSNGVVPQISKNKKRS